MATARSLTGGVLPGHLRTADDAVGAVIGEAHPCFVRAIVIGRPQDESRRSLPDDHRLCALGIQAAPDTDERVTVRSMIM